MVFSIIDDNNSGGYYEATVLCTLIHKYNRYLNCGVNVLHLQGNMFAEIS